MDQDHGGGSPAADLVEQRRDAALIGDVRRDGCRIAGTAAGRGCGCARAGARGPVRDYDVSIGALEPLYDYRAEAAGSAGDQDGFPPQFHAEYNIFLELEAIERYFFSLSERA
jgi:hypothetical protein